MNLPPYPQPGQPVRSEWGRAIVDYLRSVTARPSGTVQVEHTPQGTTYNVVRRRGGSASADHPYKGIDASEDDTPKVEVTPGTHNGIVPTIDGVSLTNDPRPKLTLGSAAKLVYAQLNLNATTAAVESVAINSTNDPTPPAGDSVTVYQTLFFVTMEDGKIKTISQNVTGSQMYQACGGQNLFGVI